MAYTASIYFLGQYRPAYFEADTARAATKALLASIRECEDYTKLCEWIKQSYSEIKKPNCAAFSVEHGARGISIAKRPHDPFLGQYMVDTTSTSDRNSPASVLKDEAGAPDKMIDAIEQTIMRFRLEDFDRRELRECALAVLEVVREGVG